MKPVIVVVALSLLATPALANPGGHTLTCSSAKGAKQAVSLQLGRSNGPGFSSPTFTITVDGVAHEFTTDDPDMMFGSTTHDAPHGKIEVIADNSEDTKATAHGGFTITAIKKSVKAYDPDGHRVTARGGAADPADHCADARGKATFRANFRGWLADAHGKVELRRQVLTCELEYDSGMAC